MMTMTEDGQFWSSCAANANIIAQPRHENSFRSSDYLHS
jgi:hypothetical protein